MTLMSYRPLGRVPQDPRLGRFIPDDDDHVLKYPYSAVLDTTVATVEKVLVLPFWHWLHDQGQEGSCVGHGSAMERAITNLIQNKLLARLPPFTRRYDPLFIWNWAKAHDEWSETNPGDDNGTSVRAGYDCLRVVGPRRIKTKGIAIVNGRPVVSDNCNTPDLSEGVEVTRWARTVDEMRTAISAGNPVVIGVNWYSNFDSPVGQSDVRKGVDYWIGQGSLGRVRGGHCVCLYGASDKRQAFRLKNSWGRDYPLVWLPYGVMETLLGQDGEATLQSDR